MKDYHVVMTFQAGQMAIHGPFRTKEYAIDWAEWHFGEDHWGIFPLNIYETLPKEERAAINKARVPQTDGEQDCC